MKLLVILSLVLGGAFATAEIVPTKDVQVSVNSVYVPGGFDSASDVFVVLSGMFPNSCYSWKTSNVLRNKSGIFEVNSMATVSQGMCLMVMVPFSKEVRLGVLGSGNHVVRFMNGDGTYLEKTIDIE